MSSPASVSSLGDSPPNHHIELPAWRERLTIVALLVAVAGVGAAFAFPWLAPAWMSTAPLDKYARATDGAAALYAVYGADSVLQGWQSENMVVVSSARITGASDLRDAQRQSLDTFFRQGSDTSTTPATVRATDDARIVRTTTRQIARDGTVTTTIALNVRGTRIASSHGDSASGEWPHEPGDYLLTLSDPAGNVDYSYGPAILSLPADLRPGRSWTGRGTFLGGQYTFTGRVLDRTAFHDGPDTLPDCIAVETRRVISLGLRPMGDDRWRTTYCAGVGVVEKLTVDSAGRTKQRRLLLRAGSNRELPPTPPSGSAAPPRDANLDRDASDTPDLSRWNVSRVAGFGRAGTVYESTIAPTVVPTDTPFVLIAGHAGDLIAYDARSADGAVRWTFRPGGTVYGRPVWDAVRARIFFGASDKRLYALDARGFFLWSVATGDNVATTPLVLADVVIFGSEDHRVYGLDAGSGRQRWSVATGAAVASSPDSVAGLAVIGSDDGTVRAIDPATGRVRWSAQPGGAVEAPIATAHGIAYVASRDGSLSAWRGADGGRLWSTNFRAPLRTRPLVLDASVYVVSSTGYVHAVARTTGARLWVSGRAGYVGPAQSVDGALLVARGDGVVHALDPHTGTIRREWTRPASTGQRNASVVLGASAGGGALWFADREPSLWRVGPGSAGALPLAWVRHAPREPFAGRPLWTTPIAFGDRAVVLDQAGGIFIVNAGDGAATRAGALPDDSTYALVEPTVHGSTLLVVAGHMLHAFALPEARPLWRFEATGSSYRPPVVAAGTVLWTTQTSFDEASTTGRLYALDLLTGRTRWSVALPALWMAAEPVIRDTVVLLGTPPSAWDLRTGTRYWSSQAAPLAATAPVLAGDLLVTAAVDVSAGVGVVLAFDAAAGTLRWRTPLASGELPHPREQLWTDGEIVIVTPESGRIVALDARTGRERWSYRPTTPRFGAVTVSDGQVLYLQQDGRVMELDMRTGAPTIRATGLDPLLTIHRRFQRPTIVNDHLLVVTGQSLFGFSIARSDSR